MGVGEGRRCRQAGRWKVNTQRPGTCGASGSRVPTAPHSPSTAHPQPPHPPPPHAPADCCSARPAAPARCAAPRFRPPARAAAPGPAARYGGRRQVQREERFEGEHLAGRTLGRMHPRSSPRCPACPGTSALAPAVQHPARPPTHLVLQPCERLQHVALVRQLLLLGTDRLQHQQHLRRMRVCVAWGQWEGLGRQPGFPSTSAPTAHQPWHAHVPPSAPPHNVHARTPATPHPPAPTHPACFQWFR